MGNTERDLPSATVRLSRVISTFLESAGFRQDDVYHLAVNLADIWEASTKLTRLVSRFPQHDAQDIDTVQGLLIDISTQCDHARYHMNDMQEPLRRILDHITDMLGDEIGDDEDEDE